MAVFELEVHVVRDRGRRPWAEHTHHVTIAVDDQPSWTRMENEARILATWMVWHIRGDMVTSAHIIGVAE